MAKAIFQEEQRFNQLWIWVINLIVVVTMIVIIYDKVENDEDGIFFPIFMLSLVLLLFLTTTLKTRIDELGIHVQFFPFIIKKHIYKWDELYSIEVVEYSPIADFGGWGYRMSFAGKGRAFNIRGNKGIQIITNDGKKRLIGTQKPEEAKTAIENYFSKTS